MKYDGRDKKRWSTPYLCKCHPYLPSPKSLWYSTKFRTCIEIKIKLRSSTCQCATDISSNAHIANSHNVYITTINHPYFATISHFLHDKYFFINSGMVWCYWSTTHFTCESTIWHSSLKGSNATSLSIIGVVVFLSSTNSNFSKFFCLCFSKLYSFFWCVLYHDGNIWTFF